MTEPLSQEEGQILYDHMEQMQREYQAWHNLMEQFHMRGVDKINEGGEDEPMYRALILWSEELAELRRVDPNKQHKFIALDAAREGG